MKAIATILWFGGIVTLCIVASQNTSSAPAKIAAPSWMRAHL
jgi:hypothetical protein